MTIPLYTPPTHPNAWHAIHAPGGYEWWHFFAEDPQRDRQVVADLVQGLIFHPRYRRQYERYRRRPTAALPPLPEQYQFVCVTICEGGGIRWRSLTHCPPAEFAASTDAPRVRLGSNLISTDGADYLLHLEPSAADPLRADLRFRPRLQHLPLEQAAHRPGRWGGEHRWIVPAASCAVEGRIGIGDEKLDFAGIGLHDHNWGTAPLTDGLSHWIRGRVCDGDSVCAFQWPVARVARAGEPVRLLEATEAGCAQVGVHAPSAEWSGPAWVGGGYPRRIRLGDLLELRDPQRVGTGAFATLARYACTWRQRHSTALCEVWRPRRL